MCAYGPHFWGDSMREASRIEQSIGTPKPSNDGRIDELSSPLHWSDIAGILDLMTLYHMFVRADTQHSKGALQIKLMIEEIISNVVAFLTKGAHMLEVLYRVHLSALRMTDTWLEQCEVSSKNKNITGGT